MLRNSRLVKYSLIAIAVAIAVTLPLTAAARTAKKQATLDVTIAYPSPTAAFSLAQIAIDNHLFPPNLNVKTTFVSGAGIVPPQATGAVQFTMAGAPAFDLAAASSGAPVKWLAQWNVPNDNQFVVRAGINKLSDLKGKTFGITTPGSFPAILLNVVLNKANLHPGDFKILNLGTTPNQIAAFLNGQIDAVVTSPPLTQQYARDLPGSHVLFDFYEAKYQWVGVGIVGYMPWVQQHPAATVGILKGLNDALKLFKSNNAVARSATAKISGLTDPTLIDIAVKAVQTRTPKTLQPVSLETERNILRVLRVNGFPQAKASLAPNLTTAVYVQRAVKLSK